jgi:hypothetical protein
MSKFRIPQYRYFKYAKWPHAVLTIQQRSEYVDVLFWLKINLKESQYRINYVKDQHQMFPNAITQVGYHFKDSTDLLAMKLKFNIVEIPF